jgi:hypothetical protein
MYRVVMLYVSTLYKCIKLYNPIQIHKALQPYTNTKKLYNPIQIHKALQPYTNT